MIGQLYYKTTTGTPSPSPHTLIKEHMHRVTKFVNNIEDRCITLQISNHFVSMCDTDIIVIHFAET